MPFVFATNIENEIIRVDIVNESYVIYNVSVEYSDITTEKLSYVFLKKTPVLEKVYINNNPGLCNVNYFDTGTEILCDYSNKDFVNATFVFYEDLNLKYDTNIYKFEFEKPVLSPTKEFHIEVYLPEKAFVAKPDNGDASIYPSNAEISIDDNGRRIIIVWNNNDPVLGVTYDYYVLFELPVVSSYVTEQNNPSYYVYVLMGVLGVMFIVGLVAIYLYYKRTSKQKIIEVLKEDERKVIDAIKELGNGCRQKDVVAKTGFSKAKVSRIIYDLSKRNIVIIERKGKTNKLYLNE